MIPRLQAEKALINIQTLLAANSDVEASDRRDIQDSLVNMAFPPEDYKPKKVSKDEYQDKAGMMGIPILVE